jgi:hypothetical protein
MRSAGSLQQEKSQRASCRRIPFSHTRCLATQLYVGKFGVEYMQIFKSNFDECTEDEIKIQVSKFSFSIERFFHLV